MFIVLEYFLSQTVMGAIISGFKETDKFIVLKMKLNKLPEMRQTCSFLLVVNGAYILID